MKASLLETLQKSFGAEPLQKVDPNTQEISNEALINNDLVAQAVIPAILTGFYKYTRIEENAENVLRGNISTDWASLLFRNHLTDLSKRVSEYANLPVSVAARSLQHTAFEAVKLIRQRTKEEEGGITVKKLFTDQRNEILQHLPAALDIGTLLDDSSLDDRTNKMEGPISNMMHTIEKKFAGTDQPSKEKKPN
jgi:hypothetical protein